MAKAFLKIILTALLFCCSWVHCQQENVTPETCGIMKIPLGPSNGTFEAKLGQIVWHVSVETKQKGKWQHSCGGVVISKQAVLTTATCVQSIFAGMVRAETGMVDLPKGWYVRRRKRFTFPGAQKPGLAYVESTKIHPDFDKKTLANNLAILRLAMPFDFVKSEGNISQICMPESKHSDLDDDPLFISGWGAGFTEEGQEFRKKLQVRQAKLIDCSKAGVAVNENEFCVSQEQDDEFDVKFKVDDDEYNDGESMKTTTDIPIKTNPCEGDIGAGIFTINDDDDDDDDENSGAKLIGIASKGGVDSCSNDNPTVFIDVYPYLKWIQEASKPYY